MPQVEVTDTIEVKSCRANDAELGTSELLEKDIKRRRFLYIVIAILFVWALGATVVAVLVELQALSEAKTTSQDLPIGIMIPMRKKPHTRLLRNLTAPKSTSHRRGLQARTLEGNAWSLYSAPVTVSGKTFEVAIDSGSATFAVAASSSLGCENYYAGACNGGQASDNYGSGSWSGAVCMGATVSFDGAAAGTPPFAGITTSNNFLTDCTPSDGIFTEGVVGMAYAALASPPFDQATLFDSVVAQNQGMANIWSLACCGWQGGTTAGTGTLVLGGVHPSLYTGSMMWTEIVTGQGFYCVKMTSPAVDTHTSGCGSGNTIIDSGSSGLTLTESVYNTVLAPINDAVNQYLSINLNCVTASDLAYFPDVSLELEGGVSLRIPPEGYLQPYRGSGDCHEFLIYKASSQSPINIIGQAVMESYYTVFDKANSRVGFAPLAGCP